MEIYCKGAHGPNCNTLLSVFSSQSYSEITKWSLILFLGVFLVTDQLCTYFQELILLGEGWCLVRSLIVFQGKIKWTLSFTFLPCFTLNVFRQHGRKEALRMDILKQVNKETSQRLYTYHTASSFLWTTRFLMHSTSWKNTPDKLH